MPSLNETDNQFYDRIQRAIATVQAWEADPLLLAECRAMIPLNLLLPSSTKNANASTTSEYERDDDSYYDGDALLLKRLALFFKESVMTWVNNPACRKCHSKATTSTHIRGPESEEEREGGASRVEVYECPLCVDGNSTTGTPAATVTTFPRYNSVRKLLETRQGRCGEFANLFGLYCRAAGFETRYVLDVTDHVWTELYVKGRWIMADSCEGIIDQPSMYEAGWGKKLSCMIGISIDSVMDVTPRYTRSFNEKDFKDRRRKIGSSEIQMKAIVKQCSAMLKRSIGGALSKARLEELERREQVEQSILDNLQNKLEWSQRYKEGRTSGSLSWRSARKEIGDQKEDQTVENIKGFHVETFYPNTGIAGGVDITLTPHSKQMYGTIAVSGVGCAVGQPKAMSVVVLDDQYLGCILQSRSFITYDALADFCDTLPSNRILACCGSISQEERNDSIEDAYQKQMQARLSSRLGGFEIPKVSNNTTFMFVGVVDHHPPWATSSNSSVANCISVHITSEYSSRHKTKLKTEHHCMPRTVSARLPESAMPLNSQILASEQQKRIAFLAFLKSNTSQAIDHRYVGYTTKPNSPVYLMDNSSYPFERIDDLGLDTTFSWNTFHLLPEPLVLEDDNGIKEDNVEVHYAPKFDIPVEISFFTSLLGVSLLKRTGGTSTTIDTSSALSNSRLIGLYFSAHWCGPCRRFTPMLAEMYTHLKDNVASTHGLEIVFVSSDKDQGSFQKYYDTMPWLAVPFSSGKTLQQQISLRYGVRGIPAFVVLDAMSGQIVVTSEESRSDVSKACQGGDQSIKNMLTNNWFPRIPKESQEMFQLLEFSCEDDDEGNVASEQEEHTYFVRNTTDKGTNQSVPKRPFDPAVVMKEMFSSLVAKGDDPNTAAAKAIQFVAAKQKESLTAGRLLPGSLGSIPWTCTVYTNCVNHPSFGVPQASAVMFTDSGNNNNNNNKLSSFRLLQSASGNILGLQTRSNASSWYGTTKHLVSSASEKKGKWVDAVVNDDDSSGGEIATCVVGTFGAEGLIALAIGYGNENNRTEEEFTLDMVASYDLIGFHGTFSSNGIIGSVGLVCGKSSHPTVPTQTDGDPPVRQQTNTETGGTGCVVRNKAKRIVQWNNHSAQAVRTVLATACKYLANARREPWTCKFRTFKLSNQVVDRINRIQGGLDLLGSLGFSVYGTPCSDFVVCLPLAMDLDGLHDTMRNLLEEFPEE